MGVRPRRFFCARREPAQGFTPAWNSDVANHLQSNLFRGERLYSPVIKHGDATAQVTFTAADDASLGDFTIEVTGHPAEGADVPNELQLIVVNMENR